MFRFLKDAKSCIACYFRDSCECETVDELGFIQNYEFNPIHDECVFIGGKKVILSSCDCHSHVMVAVCQLLDPL